jgi:uncharacterized cupin superfamily protein
MQRVDIDEVSNWMGPAAVKRSVSDALGAEDVALNYYELEPGESFAFGYHRHDGQEEIVYVIEGEATFETEDGDVEVGAGDAIYFAPGEWQQGWNRTDDRVIALALGAPQEMGETDIERECADCGERTRQEIVPTEERDALLTKCVDCGAVTGRFD